MGEKLFPRSWVDASMKWPWYAFLLLPFVNRRLYVTPEIEIEYKVLFGSIYVTDIRSAEGRK